VEAGRKINVQPRVIAEVAKAQVGQVHAVRMMGKSRIGEFFWKGRRHLKIILKI
jgi:hypothetical protein